jgi:hypothetical protein
MLLQQRFQQIGYLPPALASTDKDYRFAAVVVDRPDTVAFFGLSGRRDHHLPAPGTPGRLERGHPTQVELLGV